jgi:hypothetical protein
LVIGYWLLVIGCWLLVVGCWLLVVGCWLLVVGCWEMQSLSSPPKKNLVNPWLAKICYFSFAAIQQGLVAPYPRAAALG